MFLPDRTRAWATLKPRVRNHELSASTTPATADRRLPFDCIALLLQGGGALGAYQGGVYEALADANIHPDWIAGISIGAINAAIIAGNPPNTRVERLREFWTQVTLDAPWQSSGTPFTDLMNTDHTRNFLNQVNANFAAVFGASGFFLRGRWSHGCKRVERLRQRASTTLAR